MPVLFFKFADLASDVVFSALPENIPLPVISFILYPEHDFLSIKNKIRKTTRNKGLDHSDTMLEERKRKMIGWTRWNLTSFIGLEAYL